MTEPPPADWRTHYLALLHEGESNGLRNAALGHYIAQRLTREELIAGLAEFHGVPVPRNTTEAAK